jgi:GWxTD domain-containing protein
MTVSSLTKKAAAVPAGLLGLLGPFLLVLGLASSGACRTYKLERKLPPDRARFLSQVDYIITKAERKIFLELPDAERDDFVEEFWERRDPDPDTAVNEYRLEYEDRVKRTAIMFPGEGRPGWQTDRGRIYILFGPPQERLTYPVEASGNCREVWYYGGFPVIFVDERCQGQYLLTAINLEHLQALNIAQGHFQRTFSEDKRFFDYKVSLLRVRNEAGVFEGKVFVDIPYNTIWFTFKDGRLETSFDVRLELSDRSGTTVWEAEGAFPLSLEERELAANRKGLFRMEFPLVIDRGLAALADQELRLDVSVKSATEGDPLKKVVEFRLKS